MQNTRILMLGWEFPPFKSGGLGTYLLGFTKELNHLGAKINFIMPYTGKKLKHDFVNIIQAKEINCIGIKSTLTPYATSYVYNLFLNETQERDVYGRSFFEEVEYYTMQAVKIGKELKCDVIHCHDWMTLKAGAVLKQALGKPLIVTIHSTEFDRTGNIHPDNRITSIEKQGMEAADLVITVSNYEKKQIAEKYGISKEKIRVVHNAIDRKSYKRVQMEKKVNEKIVLFLGRLTLQKGGCFFLQAAKKVLEKSPDTKFIIVGTGDQLPSLIEQSIQLGIAHKTHFTGFDPDVSKYYSVADVFVMPSVSEPFGLTALEALSCEVPVIVSKQSGVSEVVRNCLKVDFWDTLKLANNITALLEYPVLSSEIRKNGAIEIKKYRDWKDVASECLEIYKEVIE